MTCIVGVVDDGKVWLGGDSHVAAGCESFPMTDVERKVFRRGDMLFGSCGPTRVNQMLAHQLMIPDHPDDMPTFVYLINRLMPNVKNAIDVFGGVNINDSADGWDFLLGYRGQLWYGCHDLSVSLMPKYGAVGCGHMIALGSLHSTGDMGSGARVRVTAALAAAAHHDVHVAPPFVVESV